MSVNADVTDVDRYAWPAGARQPLEGSFEESLTITCARIARHMSRTGARVIGLLPVGADLGSPTRLAPLLLRVAAALTSFIEGDVAFIDAWPAWAQGGESPALAESAAAAASGMRELQPRVLEITPPACDDAATAAVALQNTLAVVRRSVGLVLVSLGDYARPGAAPASVILVDQVVMLVGARRTSKAAVAFLSEHIPADKRLGAILVG